MILKRFYDDKLAQASFLIGCAKTGEAAILDPNRDIEQYTEAAENEGVRITVVTETHIHADYVSGSRELADRTGAQLFLSDEGDADWKYGFADQPNVTLVKDGDSIRVGNVRLDVMKTPGHTPEHIAFILTDQPASSEPQCVFTGDCIFVGDVGRPDLLERAAGFEGTMERAAKTLFQTLQRFKALPDYLMLWPAHGAGSACGKSLGAVPVTTLGYEKKVNWALREPDEATFVEQVLAGQPEAPIYFKEMKRMNKVGPPMRNTAFPPKLEGKRINQLLEKGEIVVDLRDSDETAKGYIPGTLNIPATQIFTNWAGWLLPYDQAIYLLSGKESDIRVAIRDLSLIGIDNVAGWLGPDALQAHSLEKVKQISAIEAVKQFEKHEVEILDIRGANEYEEGHIPGVCHIPLGYLTRSLGNLTKEKPIVVQCAGGTRSPIGVSLLRKHGFTKLINMTGGFMEYEEAALPIEV